MVLGQGPCGSGCRKHNWGLIMIAGFSGGYNNPSNAEATFVRITRAQRFLKTI